MSAVLHDMYVEVKGKVTGELGLTNTVALITDFWTSSATDSYLGVTAHYLTPNWELHTRVLETCCVVSERTGILVVVYLTILA